MQNAKTKTKYVSQKGQRGSEQLEATHYQNKGLK